MGTAVSREVVATRRFRFDNVVVDEGAARLLIDGRERACSHRAFQLLLILCEAPGRALSRQTLLDLLWPGGQIVADEALTQAVFRARACLGAYAERIVTVRGIGFRLDAEVERDDGEGSPARPTMIDLATAPAANQVLLEASEASAVEFAPPRAVRPAPIGTPVPPTIATVDPGARVRRRRHWLWLPGAALALVAAALLFRSEVATVGRAPPLDVGYGLQAEDAHAGRADSVGLLREAFQYEARGDRARARALLETVHASDTQTPLPAMFLALWAIGGGDIAAADGWLMQARQRAAAFSDPYLTALLQYIHAERGTVAQDVLRYAGTVVDLRPQAWQMRLARAHLLMADGYRDAALVELKAIELLDHSHRKTLMVVADLASLGDVAAAETALQRLEAGEPPSARLLYVRGRIHWSRGDFAAARRVFLDTAEVANREAAFDLRNRSLANAGVIAMSSGEHAEAVRLLERARAGMVETRWVRDELDMSLILAQLQSLLGAQETAEAELQRAEAILERSKLEWLRDQVLLFRARLAPNGVPTPAGSAGGDPVLRGLLTAHAALQRGDRAAARAAYADAERRISPQSLLLDELRLLGARLGESVPPALPVDPPFPPLARLATRAAMAAEAAPLGETSR